MTSETVWLQSVRYVYRTWLYVHDASPRLRKLCTGGVPAGHVSVHIKRLFRLVDPKEAIWGWLTGVKSGTPLSVPGFNF